jgi:putative flippase GtrA
LISQLSKRWFVSGTIVYIFDFLVFVLLFSIFGEILISNSASMLLSGVLAFFLNQVWVYKTRLNILQLFKFTISVFVSLVLNSALIMLSHNVTNSSIQVTKITVSVILLPINFLLSRALFGRKTA